MVIILQIFCETLEKIFVSPLLFAAWDFYFSMFSATTLRTNNGVLFSVTTAKR